MPASAADGGCQRKALRCMRQPTEGANADRGTSPSINSRRRVPTQIEAHHRASPTIVQFDSKWGACFLVKSIDMPPVPGKILRFRPSMCAGKCGANFNAKSTCVLSISSRALISAVVDSNPCGKPTVAQVLPANGPWRNLAPLTLLQLA